MAVFEKITTQYNKYFIPFVWATALVARARKEGRISYDGAVSQMMKVAWRIDTESFCACEV